MHRRIPNRDPVRAAGSSTRCKSIRQILNDYPKMALWNNPQPGGAYHLTFNLFLITRPSPGCVFLRSIARRCSLAGPPMPSHLPFLRPVWAIPIAWSLLAFALAIRRLRAGMKCCWPSTVPASNTTTLTTVKGWKFHVDFVTPALSTLGVGANHTPDALITVNPFIEAWTNTAGFTLVPQSGTADRIQTLGDKIMTPLVYQNRSGTESLWAPRPIS